MKLIAEAMRKISISASFADDGWWTWSKVDAPRKQFLASLTKANETDRRLMSRAQEENPSIRASQLLASQSMESGPRSEQHSCNEVVSVETWYSSNWLMWLMVMFLPLEGLLTPEGALGCWRLIVQDPAFAFPALFVKTCTCQVQRQNC